MKMEHSGSPNILESPSEEEALAAILHTGDPMGQHEAQLVAPIWTLVVSSVVLSLAFIIGLPCKLNLCFGSLDPLLPSLRDAYNILVSN